MTSLKLPFWFALAASTHLAFSAETPKKITSVEGIAEYQFDNGLRALLFPDGSRSKVTVNMTVLVGSRHEGGCRAQHQQCGELDVFNRWTETSASALEL